MQGLCEFCLTYTDLLLIRSLLTVAKELRVGQIRKRLTMGNNQRRAIQVEGFKSL